MFLFESSDIHILFPYMYTRKSYFSSLCKAQSEFSEVIKQNFQFVKHPLTLRKPVGHYPRTVLFQSTLTIALIIDALTGFRVVRSYTTQDDERRLDK
jgi:hypothetical protein